MGFDTYTKLFDSSVIPVINYGTEVLGYLKNLKSDSIQIKAIKIFLGVHRFASNDAVQGDMGWLPNHLKHTLNVLRYWNRLVDLDDSRLTRKVFDAEYDLNKKGSWCYFVKDTLSDLDMAHIYNAKICCDLGLCRTRLFISYANTWANNLKKKPKLRVYMQIKDVYATEKYVMLNLERNQRSILAQLRFGILPLYIETGRYTNVKLENRICTFCDDNKIENELHFTMNCSLYKDSRSIFFNSINMDFTYSLADNFRLLCIEQPRKLSKFISNIWQIRKDKMYIKG